MPRARASLTTPEITDRPPESAGQQMASDLAEERLRDFAALSSEWLWETDADLRFTFLTEKAARASGLALGDLIGRKRQEFVAGEDRTLEFEMHLAWLDQRMPFQDFSYKLTAADGSRRLLQISGAPMFAADGSFLGYRGVGRDITEVETTRDALLQANRQLTAANKARSDAMGSLTEANALLEEQNEEMQRVQLEVEHSALHDPLTGIPNRRYLDDHMRSLHEDGARPGALIGALHIDLDRFKQINDTFGHAAGDAVLVHASNLLKREVEAEDFVARVGGDEFVVVGWRTGGEREFICLAQRLVEAFAQPMAHEGRNCWIGASIGVASAPCRAGAIDDVLVNADIALYRAKKRGRGCFQTFSAEVQDEIVRHRKIADGLRSGLANGEIVPWYQPQVSAATMEISGFEALARWQVDTCSVLQPVSFLGIAEEINLTPAIDRSILEQAVRDLERWDRVGLGIPKVSVNVSARRLLDPDLAGSLGKMAVPFERIGFELLESIFLDEIDPVMSRNIEALRAMGFTLELDDFGSGRTSIIGLVKLNPDAIKIDRELIASLCRDPAHQSLVRAIVGIGQSLGLRIVAEGVENREEMDLLIEMGCHELQGYFFGKPMPAAKVPEFVESWAHAWAGGLERVK